jgi:hypothetical protein
LNEIKYYLELGYKPQEIFILSPSVKNQTSPIRQLENRIKTELNGIQIFIPTGDDEKLDGDVLEGKLVFSTFHQSKGLERKVIIVFGFDNSYFEYYKINNNGLVCPNELYVATTRSLEHLTVFHHFENDYLPFLCKEKLRIYCNMENDKMIRVKENKSTTTRKSNPTDIIKHLPQEVIDYCFNYFETEIIQDAKEMINIPLKTKQEYKNGSNGYESVSEITGIAIPCYFEYKTKGKIDILNKIPYKPKKCNPRCLIQLEEDDCDEENEDDKLLQKINLNIKKISPSELLYIANAWNSIKNGFLFKKLQITNYNWLSKENLDKCIERIERLKISRDAKFEYKSEIKNEKELLNREITGYFDCIDNTNLYEFKCVQKIEKEHILQLVIYMYLNEKQKEKKRNSMLSHQGDFIIREEYKLKQYKDEQKTKQEYNIGDIIKYTIFTYDVEEQGTIIKMHKNGKIQVENINKRRDIIVKQMIKSITKRSKFNILEEKIVNIENKIIQLKLHSQENTNYYLYNILTDELIQIRSSLENLIKIIEHLFYSKYSSSIEITDETFLTRVIQIRNNY